MTDMPTTYDTKTTTTTTTASSGGGGVSLQKDYVRTIPGILKIVEIVVSLITFICSISVPWSSYGGGWVSFVSISTMLSVAILFLFYLFNVYSSINAVPWPFLELVFYAVYTICFLIAAIVAASKAYLHSAIGASAFFAFAATAVYGVDTFFQFRAYRSGQTEMATGATATTTTTSHTAETGQAQY